MPLLFPPQWHHCANPPSPPQYGSMKSCFSPIVISSNLYKVAHLTNPVKEFAIRTNREMITNPHDDVDVAELWQNPLPTLDHPYPAHVRLVRRDYIRGNKNLPSGHISKSVPCAHLSARVTHLTMCAIPRRVRKIGIPAAHGHGALHDAANLYLSKALACLNPCEVAHGPST